MIVEDGPGTLICEEDPSVEAPVVSGIAFNRDEAAISIAGLPQAPGVAHALLKPVADAALEIDMIVITARGEGVDLSFTVHRDDYAKALELTRQAAGRFPKATVAGSPSWLWWAAGCARTRASRRSFSRRWVPNRSTSGSFRPPKSRSACWSRRRISSGRCARCIAPTAWRKLQLLDLT